MKKEIDAKNLKRNLEWETIEFETLDNSVKILMMKKLLIGKLIYNEIYIDKKAFADCAKEFLEEQ